VALLRARTILQSSGGMAGGKMMWISVKDRLPVKSGKYTVKTVEGSISPHEHERVILGRLYPTGFRFLVGDWQRVTHWLEVV
jgi:hypothetical protein